MLPPVQLGARGYLEPCDNRVTVVSAARTMSANHRGCVTVVTLPFWAMSTTATGLWFLIVGVIEKTVPGCVFRTSAITAARFFRLRDISVSCAADRAT